MPGRALARSLILLGTQACPRGRAGQPAKARHGAAGSGGALPAAAAGGGGHAGRPRGEGVRRAGWWHAAAPAAPPAHTDCCRPLQSPAQLTNTPRPADKHEAFGRQPVRHTPHADCAQLCVRVRVTCWQLGRPHPAVTAAEERQQHARLASQLRVAQAISESSHAAAAAAAGRGASSFSTSHHQGHPCTPLSANAAAAAAAAAAAVAGSSQHPPSQSPELAAAASACWPKSPTTAAAAAATAAGSAAVEPRPGAPGPPPLPSSIAPPPLLAAAAPPPEIYVVLLRGASLLLRCGRASVSCCGRHTAALHAVAEHTAPRHIS
jgi:hypothetical protein